MRLTCSLVRPDHSAPERLAGRRPDGPAPHARWPRVVALSVAALGLMFSIGCSPRSSGPNVGADRGSRGPGITVYAASSLTDVLESLGTRYMRETGQAIKFSFASTGLLARQIEAGAKTDFFFSADLEWMDYLEQRGLIEPDSRREMLGNRLVLIAPADSDVIVGLAAEPDLARTLLAALGKRGRLALADPDGVPAGRYAKAALESLRVWPVLEPRLARAENVRAAMRFVARGEAALGAVFLTDARAEPRVRIVDVFAESLHPPIRYSLARVRGARRAGFETWLRGAEARRTFEQAGFIVLAEQNASDFQPRHSAK